MDQTSIRCTILPTIAAAAAFTFAVVDTSSALAQTLTQPNSQSGSMTRTPPSRDIDKSVRAQRLKSCSIFGPGFVNIPGSDACIKIGGSVTTEVGR